MYVRIPEYRGLAEPTVTKPAVKPYKAPITNGGQFIREDDADKLLTIVSGPSPYQDYILPVIAVQASSKLPKKFLRIVSSPGEVPEHLRGRFVKIDNKVVGGTIDRATGTIYMIPAPGRRDDTRLEFALHETVHLLSHPFMSLVDERTFQSKYGRSCTAETDVGSFQRKYCFGFGEGATQTITEQIMEAQGISKYSSDRPYKEFTPPVLELIRIFSLERFARAYFWGAIKEFTEAMELRWGNAWLSVANITSGGDTKRALSYIKELEVAYIKRRGPKGDFPIQSTSTRYALGTIGSGRSRFGEPPPPSPGDVITPPPNIDPGIAPPQRPTPTEVSQYAAIRAAIVFQLNRRLNADDERRILERRQILRNLFKSMPKSLAPDLLGRLLNMNDPLAKLFHGRLHRATRKEMIDILAKESTLSL